MSDTFDGWPRCRPSRGDISRRTSQRLARRVPIVRCADHRGPADSLINGKSYSDCAVASVVWQVTLGRESIVRFMRLPLLSKSAMRVRTLRCCSRTFGRKNATDCGPGQYKKVAVMQGYRTAYKSLSDVGAKDLARRVFKVDQMTLDLRKKAFEEIAGGLVSKKRSTVSSTGTLAPTTGRCSTGVICSVNQAVKWTWRTSGQAGK